MKVLTAVRISGSEGARRLLSPLVLTWVFVFLLCFNSYASDAEDLINAAGNGDISTVQALLAKGAGVNAKDNNGMTALMHASELGRLEVVQALLAKGADVDAKDDYGRTVLIVAVGSTYAHLDVVQALLAKGAAVNEKDKDGRTALSLAKTNRHSEIAQLLIKAGAKDVNNSGEVVTHGIVVGLVCGFSVILSVFLVKYLRKKHS